MKKKTTLQKAKALIRYRDNLVLHTTSTLKAKNELWKKHRAEGLRIKKRILKEEKKKPRFSRPVTTQNMSVLAEGYDRMRKRLNKRAWIRRQLPSKQEIINLGFSSEDVPRVRQIVERTLTTDIERD